MKLSLIRVVSDPKRCLCYHSYQHPSGLIVVRNKFWVRLEHSLPKIIAVHFKASMGARVYIEIRLIITSCKLDSSQIMRYVCGTIFVETKKVNLLKYLC